MHASFIAISYSTSFFELKPGFIVEVEHIKCTLTLVHWRPSSSIQYVTNYG